jgi:NAD(P)-dependent dehydrogenase (short-subunit alcohol dehydrogenase family)
VRSPQRFAGRVGVVTGAARGIGRAVVTALVDEGARVVVQDLDGDEAERLVAELGREHVVASAGDGGDRGAAEAAMALAVERFGHIDLLVNNTAGGGRRPILEIDAAEAEASFRTTFWSAFHATQIASRRMIAQGKGGAIVMVSSLSAQIPIPGGGIYSAAKAAVNHLVLSFAMELAAHGIRVNAVAPGLVDTPGERAIHGARLQVMGERVALGRPGTPEDIANAVAFLLSDEASYITGRVLGVDGGLPLPPGGRPVSRP